MSKNAPTNLAASIRQKLLNRARKRNEDFQLVLTYYALERLLYRLSKSEYANEFVLKGALMFLVWTDTPYRPTLDLDLLGYGESSTQRLISIFKTLCKMHQEDGLVFAADSVSAEGIRGQQEYNGLRITLTASLAQAISNLQIDVGFGDVVIPDSEQALFPSMLNMPSPAIRTYTKVSVIAEKYEALVHLGIANSRMKDFCDIWVLSQTFSFQGNILAQAIEATFSRRKTELPIDEPIALSREFAEDRAKQSQWTAFVKRSRLNVPVGSLDNMITSIHTFLIPPTESLVSGQPFDLNWRPGGPWRNDK